MKFDKPEKEQRDWTGYGSAERPVIVMYYHVVDKHGTHRVISINDYAIWDLFGDLEAFERHLAARYRSFELVGSSKVIVKPAAQTATLPEGAQELKSRIEELRAKHPGICSEPWMPEQSDRQTLDNTAITPTTTAPDDDPSAPSHSRENSVDELLMAICDAIFSHIAPVVAGTLKEGGPAELAPIDEGFMWLRLLPEQMSGLLGSGTAETDLAAAVALFPSGVRAMITARVDARVHVSGSADSLEVSISQCNEPEFLFSELYEPYDATHALHLICDPAKDTGSTFVLVEFSAGKFAPKGWVDGETAARWAAEGAKRAEAEGLIRRTGELALDPHRVAAATEREIQSDMKKLEPITYDGNTYLNDIGGLADLMKEEVEAFQTDLREGVEKYNDDREGEEDYDLDGLVPDAAAFELEVDAISDELQSLLTRVHKLRESVAPNRR